MTVDELKALMREWGHLSDRYILIHKDEREATNARKQEIVRQLSAVGLDISVGDFGETYVSVSGVQIQQLSIGQD